MLRPPYTRYDRLFVYYFDRLALPPVLDPDLIGTWVEDDNLYKGLLQGLFADPRFWRAKNYLLSGFIAGMEGDLLAALPPGGVRILHRGSREMWRLWLLRNRAGEQ